MNARTRGRLAWGIAIGSIVLVALFAAFSFTFGNVSGGPSLVVTVVVATGAFGVVGATIASRTGNAVGWALLAVIGVLTVSFFTGAYATYSLAEAARPLPLTTFAAWVSTLTFYLSIALVVAIPLLYPTGSPRWRWVWRLYLASVAVTIVGFAILPQELSLLTNEPPGPANPYAVEAWKRPIGTILAVAGLSIVLCAALSVASLIVRYRKSHGDERQQVKWLAYVGVAAIVGFIVNAAIPFNSNPAPGAQTVISNTVFLIFLWIVVLGIPAACGVAILKYHLYDLDVVVRKTVVFTVVAATLTVSYLAILALATVGPLPRVVVGIVLLAVTFRPVRQAARVLADRIAYGRRASAYEVLTEFSGRVGEAYATDDVLPRMAQILAKGTGASSARVYLRLGGELRAVAAWPDEVPNAADERLIPVVHQGEELGALTITMPANDPMDPARQRLVADLASQAGLVLRNVKLIEELRASRQRIVAAQDDERRKIERNIHDGAQQRLVALQVKLRLAEQLAGRDADRTKEMLSQLQAEAGGAIEELRDLARGIYPPLLADRGLAAALEAQARKAPLPVAVEAHRVGRYPQEVEAAVYFCTLEALNNVAKYANASRATVRLSQANGSLTFEVADDGDGFDPAATGYGTGLLGMADRLEAIGGDLSVASAPGEGTTIRGRVTAPEVAA